MKNIKRKMKRLFYLRVAVLMTFFLGLCFAFPPLPVQASCLQSARLFGVTGEGGGSEDKETLFELSQDNAMKIPISSEFFSLILSKIDPKGKIVLTDGEAIAFNPDDGLLYHLSGSGTFGVSPEADDAFFESIDPDTFTINKIDFDGFTDPSAPLFSDTAFAFTFNPSTGGFLVSARVLGTENSGFFKLTTDGIVTKLATLDHKSKGLAFVGSTLYSVSSNDNLLRTINPATGETLSSVVITSSFTIVRSHGLATHPDGGLWGLLRGSDDNRHLVTIDPDSDPVVATDIGSTGDAFASIAFVVIPPIEFSTFTLKKAMVKFKHKHDNDELVVDDEYMVKGKFVLGEDSNGIDPFDECVAVNVGTSSFVITPDSPNSSEWGGPGIFKFKGTIDGAHVKMKIAETDLNTFRFKINVKGVDLTGTNNPLFVELFVGDDGGQSNIRLKGELNSWWKGKKRNQHHGDDDSSGHKKWKKLKKWKKHRGDDDSSDDD